MKDTTFNNKKNVSHFEKHLWNLREKTHPKSRREANPSYKFKFFSAITNVWKHSEYTP